MDVSQSTRCNSVHVYEVNSSTDIKIPALITLHDWLVHCTSTHLNCKTALSCYRIESNFAQCRWNITQIASIWIKIAPCYQHLVCHLLHTILAAVILDFLNLALTNTQHTAKLSPFAISNKFLCKILKLLFPVYRFLKSSFSCILFYTGAYLWFHFYY